MSSPPSSIHTQLHTFCGNLLKRVVPRTYLPPREIIYDYGKSTMNTENRSAHLKWDSIMCVKSTLYDTLSLLSYLHCVVLWFTWIVFAASVLFGIACNLLLLLFSSQTPTLLIRRIGLIFLAVLYRCGCFRAHRSDRDWNHGIILISSLLVKHIRVPL